MPRLVDDMTYAIYWSVSSQKQRDAGKHDLGDADLAHVFGGEFGLSVEDRAYLFRLLLKSSEKAARE